MLPTFPERPDGDSKDCCLGILQKAYEFSIEDLPEQSRFVQVIQNCQKRRRRKSKSLCVRGVGGGEKGGDCTAKRLQTNDNIDIYMAKYRSPYFPNGISASPKKHGRAFDAGIGQECAIVSEAPSWAGFPLLRLMAGEDNTNLSPLGMKGVVLGMASQRTRTCSMAGTLKFPPGGRLSKGSRKSTSSTARARSAAKALRFFLQATFGSEKGPFSLAIQASTRIWYTGADGRQT